MAEPRSYLQELADEKARKLRLLRSTFADQEKKESARDSFPRTAERLEELTRPKRDAER
jgi:hypothetical protein